MRGILLLVIFLLGNGTSLRPCIDLDFPIDIENVARSGVSVVPDAEPLVLNGVDLNGLVLIERSGRYYVAPRDNIPVDVPEFLQLTMVRFQESRGPFVIGFDAAIRPMPIFSVGFLEGVFRHFAGLPMSESPSVEQVKFINVARQGGPQGDPTFGTLPVGHVGIDSVRASFARSDLALSSLFGREAPALFLLRLRKVAFITRADWLLDPSHNRFVFSRYAVQDPGVSDVEKAMSFVFIDAGVWNGSPGSVASLLRVVDDYMNGPMGVLSVMRILAAKPRLALFMNAFGAYLLRPGLNTDFMRLVRCINRVVGDSSEMRNYYEIVLTD